MWIERLQSTIVISLLAAGIAACAGPGEQRAAADEILNAKVQAALYEEVETGAANVNPRTKDGIVTLHGVVDTEKDRQLAVSAAQRVLGVGKVIDRLVVEGTGPELTDPEELSPAEDEIDDF